MKKYNFFEYFIESSKKSNMDDIAIVIGRFQPFHLGHKKVVDEALRKYGKVAIVIIEGKKSKQDRTKNPFTFQERKKYIRKVYPNGNKVKIIKAQSAYPEEYLKELETMNLNPVALYAGADRVKSYENMISNTKKKINIDTRFHVSPIPRSTESISSTKIRNFLKNGDLDSFKKLVPNKLWPYFEEMSRKVKGE